MGAIKTPTSALPPVSASSNGSAAGPPAKESKLVNRLRFMAGAFFWVELFFILYLIRPEDWIPGLHIIPMAKVVGVFVIIALLLSVGQVKQGVPKEVVYLGVLIVLMGLSSLLSPVWKGGAVQETENFAKVALIILVMALCVTTMERLKRLIFLQSACAGIVVILSVIRRHQVEGRLGGILNGIYTNPNDLALAINLTFPFCFVFMLRAKNPIRKCVWLFIMLVMIVALLMTASRGGLIGVVIAAGGCVWGFGVRQRRILLVAFAFVATLIMLPVAGKLALQRMRATFNANEDAAGAYESAQARKELLQKSLQVTMEYPLFGVGPGNFQVIGGWHETHDVFTEWSAEVGIPALIVFLMVFYRAFRNVWAIRQSSTERSELAMFTTAVRINLVVFAVCAFFYPVAYHFFVYFLFAYATALYRIASSGAQSVGVVPDACHHPGAVRLANPALQSKPGTVWTT
ncbi:MAG: O-antigen ligase family protein [Terriglobia bacterium]